MPEPTERDTQQDPAPQNDAAQDFLENQENITFVSQDPELPDPVVADPAPAPVADPNAQQAQPNSDGTKPDPTGTPPETKPETFDFMTTNEAGESVFDEQAAIDFATTKPENAVNVAEPVVLPVAAPIASDPAKPGEPEQTYEQIMTANVMSPFDYLQKYRDMGFDEVMATNYAKADIQKDLDKHFGDRRFNSLEEKFTSKEKALEEKAEMVKLAPLSAQNINNVVQTGNWGTADRLQSALFNKDIGGQFFTYLYKTVNPDHSFKSGKEYGEALNDFYTRITASPEGAHFLSEFSRAQIFMANRDKMIQHARATKGKVDGQNAQSNVQSINNKQTNASQTPVSDKQGLNGWLDDNSHG